MSETFRIAARVELASFVLDVEIVGGRRPVALIGPNGSGKTTLLRLVCGAVPASACEIVVGARTLASTREGILLPPEERRVGYLPQGFGLFSHLSALENVAFGSSASALFGASTQALQKARAMLEKLGCAELAERRTGGLSGGEKQRVALARALVTNPEILLLDEPLSALDVGIRRQVRRFLSDQVGASGCPTLVVTHDVRDVLAFDADIFVLDRGRIVQRGTLDELRANPGSDFVAEFVHSA